MAKKKVAKKDAVVSSIHLVIPKLQQNQVKLRLVGDRPLLVNNKMAAAKRISATYDGGKAGKIKSEVLHPDEAYAEAFYTFPSSKLQPPNPKAIYGVPTSGIKKCADAAIRTTGLTDNTTIGLIGKSFFVLADEAGLSQIKFKKLVRDIRPVNIGSGQKTVPSMRHRPMFMDWYIDIDLLYNPLVISTEQLVNLFMHAGAYIGLCELRAQKKQGECGGFYVKTDPKS